MGKEGNGRPTCEDDLAEVWQVMKPEQLRWPGIKMRRGERQRDWMAHSKEQRGRLNHMQRLPVAIRCIQCLSRLKHIPATVQMADVTIACRVIRCHAAFRTVSPSALCSHMDALYSKSDGDPERRSVETMHNVSRSYYMSSRGSGRSQLTSGNCKRDASQEIAAWRQELRHHSQRRSGPSYTLHLTLDLKAIPIQVRSLANPALFYTTSAILRRSPELSSSRILPGRRKM